MRDSHDDILPVQTVPSQAARSRIRLVWGKASLEADFHISPASLLAIGGMVGTILLAVPPIVRAAGRIKRR